MDRQPREPCAESRELKTHQMCDSRSAPDRCKGPLVNVPKRCVGFAANGANDVLRCVAAFLHGRRCDAGNPSAVLLDRGQIADHENVVAPR